MDNEYNIPWDLYSAMIVSTWFLPKRKFLVLIMVIGEGLLLEAEDENKYSDHTVAVMNDLSSGMSPFFLQAL